MSAHALLFGSEADIRSIGAVGAVI